MLLDTHAALWLLDGDARLGEESREAATSAPEVLLSVASVWELAIKARLGRVQLVEDFVEQVDRAGVRLLVVEATHALAVRESDLAHGDPFDHLIVTQARLEGLPLMTADRAILAAAPRGVRLLDARA